MTLIKLGTRASSLALAQTDRVAKALRAIGIEAHAETFSTRGDRELEKPLQALGDKGIFTAELEHALKKGQIHAAVHSAKDMSAIDDPDLPIVAVLPRDAHADVLISHTPNGINGLPKAARLGTSSLRRAAQVRAVRPDIEVLPIRGNVQTRLKKWRDGQVDAIILAAAGIHRLDLAGELPLHSLDWPYAPCQGIIAIQTSEHLACWKQINHAKTMRLLRIERALIRGLGANCRQPVACQVNAEGGNSLDINLYAWDQNGFGHQIRGDLLLDQDQAHLIAQSEDMGKKLAGQLPSAFGCA